MLSWSLSPLHMLFFTRWLKWRLAGFAFHDCVYVNGIADEMSWGMDSWRATWLNNFVFLERHLLVSLSPLSSSGSLVCHRIHFFPFSIPLLLCHLIPRSCRSIHACHGRRNIFVVGFNYCNSIFALVTAWALLRRSKKRSSDLHANKFFHPPPTFSKLCACSRVFTVVFHFLEKLFCKNVCMIFLSTGQTFSYKIFTSCSSFLCRCLSLSFLLVLPLC